MHSSSKASRFAEPPSVDVACASSSNANAVAPLTPTASALASGSTVLPASSFVLPEARDDDPLFAAEILAPWSLLKVISKNEMSAIEAVRAMPAGARIAKFYGEVQTTPTMYTLQLAEHVHVTCSQGGPTYTNHSCAPNAFFDMAMCTESAPFPVLTALRDIAQGEEITFHYNHTEWHMAVPFFCLCGAATCAGKIEGFAHLDDATKRSYEPYLSPFIARKWRQMEAEQAAEQQKAQAGAEAQPSTL